MEGTIFANEYFWLCIGFGGQIFFTARFVVQWLASEKAKKSVMPVSFWFLSIGGSLMLLSYAIYRRDPVFILGQSCGSFIYLRNLHLIHNEKKRKEEENDEKNPKHSSENLRDNDLPKTEPEQQG